MDVQLPAGTYVVAVSGGVDSVALLHVLQMQRLATVPNALHLFVAHFNHGIREDANEDRKLVEAMAKSYGLPFVYEESQLGARASEALARERRYVFLRAVQKAAHAQAIVTAHHQDDLIETAIINLLRGTGRKGMTSLQSRSGIERPLLGISKQAIQDYANAQNLKWREDSTNSDDRYLRNYIRHHVVTRIRGADRERLLAIISNLQHVNAELDTLLDNQLHIQSVSGMIDRQWFNQLPHSVAREVMASWLRSHGETSFNRKTLEHLVVAAKVARAHSGYSVSKAHQLRVQREVLALSVLER